MKELKRLFRLIVRLRNKLTPSFFLENYKPISRAVTRCVSSGKPLIIGGPSIVDIAVCNDCNYKCLYCFEHSPSQISGKSEKRDDYLKARMAPDIFKKLIDDLADMGTVKVICLPGRIGEGFLHPDFMDMCRYIKAKGFRCYITSNGSLITEENACSLVDMGIDELYISLNAATPKTHHALTGADTDDFGKIVKMLKILTGYKKKAHKDTPKVFVTNVICSLNYHEAPGMVELGRDIGVDNIGFHRMYFCERRRELTSDLLLKDEHITVLRKSLIDAAVTAKKNKISTNIPFFTDLLLREKAIQAINYRRKSRNVKKSCIILADGVVYAADHPRIIGNIDNAPFLDVWFSEPYLKLRKKAPGIIGEEKLFPCFSFCRCCDNPLYESNGQ